MLTFTEPALLVLLALLPVSVWIAWRRLATRMRPDPRSGVAALRLEGHALTGVIVRGALIGLLVLALAGAQIVTVNRRLAVAFVVDASDSIGAAGIEQAYTFVREALRAMRPASAQDGPLDTAAVVVFGADAQIDRALSGLRDLQPFGAQIRSGGTNVEAALRLGLSLLPTDAARRIVLLSDGRATTGNADAAARLVRAANARLDVVALPSQSGPDAAVERVDTPQRASVGQTIPVSVIVRSNIAQRATLSLFAGPDLVAQQEVNLLVGQNTFNVAIAATRAGLSPIRATVSGAQDAMPRNNTLAAALLVGGPPRILLVAPAPTGGRDETSAMRAALDASGIDYDTVTPGGMPSEIQSLAAYQAVVLMNAPAREMSLRAMYSLQSYVRDIGGGLVVIGGPSSYGVGGYFQTPLEETLPVEMRARDPKRFPSIAMAIVMDKSGSMSLTENGTMKIRLAAEAAARAVELLNDDDEVTVIGFDTEPVDVIGPFTARERAAYTPRILRIGPGGGGIYAYEALKKASDVLGPSTRKTKLAILLADGNDTERQSGARELVTDMRRRDINVSVVAIGNGSDVPFLTDIARLGEGRFHLTDRAANLPNIFTEEAALAQRSYVQEVPFFPTDGTPSPILNGLSRTPALLGYVLTSAKPAAQVALQAREGDPLLATWQYGLGRAVAFTSDATARWAKDWVGWADFPRFWAQAIRWTILERADTGAQVRVRAAGDRSIIEAELPAARMAAEPDLRLQAAIIDADGAARTYPLVQVSPGHYEAELPALDQGAYLARIEAPGASDRSAIERIVPFSAGYSTEYAPPDGTGPPALEGWAGLGGGTRLSQPAEAFALNIPAAASRTELAPLLMLLATLLLPLDVAARRLAVDILAGLRRVAARLRGQGVPRIEPALARVGAAQHSRPASASAAVTPINTRAPQEAPSPEAVDPAETAAALLRRRREQREAARTPVGPPP
ncbi:MAG: VWA domain-containing protein [Thermoflexales bacterium]|nr:VWA domain-containing protein [Thermoflexales bacterium]